MKSTKYVCDMCSREVKKEDCLTMNVFPKVGGQRGSLGSKDVCKDCYKVSFNEDNKNE